MKTWLANLHWTTRLLISACVGAFLWVDQLSHSVSGSGLTITLILTFLLIYWATKPLIRR